MAGRGTMPVNVGDTIVQITSGEEGGGTLYSPGPKQIVAVPSVNELVTASPAPTTGQILMSITVKAKELTVTFDGAYRFIWSVYATGGSDTTYSAIYRNGTQVGASHAVAPSLASTLTSEDIGGWSVGDLAQLYVWSGQEANNTTVSVFNFGLWAEYALMTPQIPAGVSNVIAAPPAPTSVSGVSNSAGQATVSWTPSAGGSYDAITNVVVTVYLNGTRSGVLSKVFAGDGTTATETLVGFTSGSTYTFAVQSANDVALGPMSTQSAGVLIQ